MNARPMLNIDLLVFILCTGSLLLALAFGAGYMWGADHERTEQSLKRIREPVPCECLCGLTMQKLRTITYRACKKGEKT